VRLRGRLQRLEHKISPPGRCAACRDRAPTVLVSVPAVIIPDNGRDPIVPTPDVGEPTDATPCPHCGWQLTILRIRRVVISSREDIARSRESGAQEAR
jgi:hypothetical protein